MPAFVYLLGKFTKPSWKRVKHYGLLYIVFQVLYTFVLKYIFPEDVVISIITPLWIVWFLLATVCYTLLCFIIPKSLDDCTKKQLFVGSLILSIVIGFVPFIGVELSLSRIIVFLPFFLAGKFGYFSCTRSATVSVSCLVMSVLLVLAYILVGNANFEALYMYGGYSESNSTWLLRFMIFVVGFCVIRFLTNSVPEKRIPILTDLGSHTLFIFLGHGFLVKGIAFFFESQKSVLFTFIVSVFITLLLWIVSLCVKKIKRLRMPI